MQFLIITNERTGIRAMFETTFKVGYSVEPYKLVAGRLMYARGYTPPIKRHFWPHPSSAPGVAP